MEDSDRERKRNSAGPAPVTGMAPRLPHSVVRISVTTSDGSASAHGAVKLSPVLYVVHVGYAVPTVFL